MMKRVTGKIENQSSSRSPLATSIISFKSISPNSHLYRVYSSALVDVVKNALKDKKEKSIPKFISLYVTLSFLFSLNFFKFLKEAMDTQDPELIYAVRDKLLKTLAECAKSDTTKLFLPGTGTHLRCGHSHTW
jgi:predicted PolB exonuclease-like 3'-5' exonuclease